MVLMGLVVYAFALAPYRLTVWAALPAADPLAARNAETFTQATDTAASGRCLALRVDPAGVLSAALLTESSLVAHTLWPDGRHWQVRLRLTGDAVEAVYLQDGGLAVWAVPSAGGPGTLYGFTVGSLGGPAGSASGAASSALAPAWQVPQTHHGAKLMPLSAGLFVAGAGADGVPRRIAVYDGRGRLAFEELLEDGLFTAWASVTVAGGVAVSGAVAGEAGLQAFIQGYSAAGSPVGRSAYPPWGPAIRAAATPTGSHWLGATPTRLAVWRNDGTEVWSARLPAAGLKAVRLFGNGQALVSIGDGSLLLDPAGKVIRRWKTAGLGSVAAGEPVDALVLSLPGGCALLDSTGACTAVALWIGVVRTTGSGRGGRLACQGGRRPPDDLPLGRGTGPVETGRLPPPLRRSLGRIWPQAGRTPRTSQHVERARAWFHARPPAG